MASYVKRHLGDDLRIVRFGDLRLAQTRQGGGHVAALAELARLVEQIAARRSGRRRGRGCRTGQRRGPGMVAAIGRGARGWGWRGHGEATAARQFHRRRAAFRQMQSPARPDVRRLPPRNRKPPITTSCTAAPRPNTHDAMKNVRPLRVGGRMVWSVGAMDGAHGGDERYPGIACQPRARGVPGLR